MSYLARTHLSTLIAGIVVRLIASSLLPGSVAAQTQTPEEIRQRVQQQVQQAQQAQRDRVELLKRGVVRIEAQKETRDLGTGIVISASPESIRILTALHVVEGARSISAIFYGDQAKPLPARKLPKYSSALDLAVIEVTASPTVKLPTGLPTYNFAANSTLQPMQHIWSVNGDWILVPNNITRLSHDGDPQKFEYSNVSVGEGFSGGPVFDDYGDVIGMHDALSGEGTSAIGIKVDSALQTLDALGYAVPKAGPAVMPTYPSVATAAASSDSKSPNVASKAAEPCASGCEAKLSSLRHLQEYRTQNRNLLCVEDVYKVPENWPNTGEFMHVSSCEGLRHTVFLRFAETDRAGDVDPTLGGIVLSGSSGRGVFRGPDRSYWNLIVRDPNFGGAFNANALTIAIEPLIPGR